VAETSATPADDAERRVAAGRLLGRRGARGPSQERGHGPAVRGGRVPRARFAAAMAPRLVRVARRFEQPLATAVGDAATIAPCVAKPTSS
jgi:hypothetical protein